MPQVLRDYQAAALNQARLEFHNGRKSALLVAPTGAGKTTVAAAIIDGATRNGRRTCFLAHRKELIDQCSKRLDDQGIDHGIIKAGNRRRNTRPVQVASLQTLINKVRPKDQQALIPHALDFDLFIIDEAHRATAKTYRDILSIFPRAILLGLTATPVRTDGRGLGELFEVIVPVSSPAELTERGFLVPARTFTSPLTPDFSQVKKKHGELDQDEVEKLIDKPKLIGDVYTTWRRHARDRQTVIFAVSRSHAAKITAEFEANGERVAYLDGETPEGERERILARLARRELQIVVNVGILTEGWDNPEISCVVLARATASLSLFLQMAGRALRTLPGEDATPSELRKKRDCLILDHGGNTKRHGFITDEREWDLEGKKSGAVNTDSVFTCKSCFAVFSKKKRCPDCGALTAETPAAGADQALPEQEAGELKEVDVKAQRQIELEYFKEMLTAQEANGYKDNYARVMFFKRFGRWPGSEIGLKKKWERVDNGNGTFRWKLKSWEIKPAGRLEPGPRRQRVLPREGAADRHPEDLRRAS